MAGPPTLQVQTYARGDVPREAMDLAVQRVRSLLRLAPEPVLFARVKLTLATDPAVEHPAIAQANVDLGGRLIRAQATGETMREAIERMGDRLSLRMERAARNWAAIRGSPAGGPACRVAAPEPACTPPAVLPPPIGRTRGDPAQVVCTGLPDRG